MFKIDVVDYNNKDFINLCQLLENEHKQVIKEQRSPNGNCLNNLENFKYVYLAFMDDKAVGCLAMKEIRDGVAELGRLYVLSDYRNHGVATKLFDICSEQAKKDGAKKLILDTYQRFEAAIKLYKKLGFKEINNYIDNSFYSICMEKII